MPRKHKKKTSPHQRSTTRHPEAQGFYTPFVDLDQQLTKSTPRESLQSITPTMPESPPPPRKSVNREESIFLEAMSDVMPLNRPDRVRIPPPPPPPSPPPIR